MPKRGASRGVTTCYLNGQFDLIVKFDDGSYGVIDCKTARSSEKKTRMYGRQLQVYTLALENPAPNKFVFKNLDEEKGQSRTIT
jgi:ATP-dependent exoDNAse (exonuclease V) beta subunit